MPLSATIFYEDRTHSINHTNPDHGWFHRRNHHPLKDRTLKGFITQTGAYLSIDRRLISRADELPNARPIWDTPDGQIIDDPATRIILHDLHTRESLADTGPTRPGLVISITSWVNSRHSVTEVDSDGVVIDPDPHPPLIVLAGFRRAMGPVTYALTPAAAFLDSPDVAIDRLPVFHSTDVQVYSQKARVVRVERSIPAPRIAESLR